MRVLAALLSLAVLAACSSPTAPDAPAGSPPAAGGAPAAVLHPSAVPSPAPPAVTADFEAKGWTVVVHNPGPAPLYLVATWERGVEGGWLEYARRGQVVAAGGTARLSAPCSWPGALRAGVLGQAGLQRVWWSSSATCAEGAVTN